MLTNFSIKGYGRALYNFLAPEIDVLLCRTVETSEALSSSIRNRIAE